MSWPGRAACGPGRAYWPGRALRAGAGEAPSRRCRGVLAGVAPVDRVDPRRLFLFLFFLACGIIVLPGWYIMAAGTGSMLEQFVARR